MVSDLTYFSDLHESCFADVVYLIVQTHPIIRKNGFLISRHELAGVYDVVKTMEKVLSTRLLFELNFKGLSVYLTLMILHF